MADAAVRPATEDDVAEIARIQLLTWRTGYAELLPPDVLAGLDEAAAAEQWHAAVTGPAEVFVATEGEWTVGFCVAGPAPTSESSTVDDQPPPDADVVALVGALHVEPRWGRRGHGGRLLAAALESLAGQGFRRGISWLPEPDTASVGFYHRAGWTADGLVRTLDAGGRPLREIRLTGPMRVELA
jgi:GNAT superfamily N-acetyltransferase